MVLNFTYSMSYTKVKHLGLGMLTIRNYGQISKNLNPVFQPTLCEGIWDADGIFVGLVAGWPGPDRHN